MRVLWLTSCARDMWEATGRTLVQSFLATKSEGRLLVCPEGLAGGAELPAGPAVDYHDLTDDPYLRHWLAANADVIPAHLGGAHPGACACPGGPYGPHDKKHHMPCVGHWFNRNASRWFRKIAALRHALTSVVLPGGVPPERAAYDAVVWVDSDCRFKRRTLARNVAGWFHHTRACFYLKYRRPVMEAGVVGYQVTRGAVPLLGELFDRYDSGRFRLDPRWDDSYQIQMALRKSKVAAVDVAYGLGERAAVVAHSELALFLEHFKGASRIKGIMT